MYCHNISVMKQFWDDLGESCQTKNRILVIIIDVAAGHVSGSGRLV